MSKIQSTVGTTEEEAIVTAAVPSAPNAPMPTMIDKLRGLRWSVTLNAANTVFTQFTYFGSAFVIFLDQLGLSKSDIGFVLSLIP
ncbi:MAG: hypothetical protein KDE31_17295, partial [Caldilineaceae bacterium]|nr:hypothetical protein [Caldilineaceae bacterium]